MDELVIQEKLKKFIVLCVCCGESVERTFPIKNAKCFECKRKAGNEFSKKQYRKGLENKKVGGIGPQPPLSDNEAVGS